MLTIKGLNRDSDPKFCILTTFDRYSKSKVAVHVPNIYGWSDGGAVYIKLVTFNALYRTYP